MKLLVLSCLIAYVSAHACLVFPEQRGGYPNNTLNKQGADACGLTDAPCGKMPPTANTMKQTFRGAMSHNITFQKNLDHYYKTAPGNWSVNLWEGTTQKGNLFNTTDPSPDKVGTGDFVTVPIMLPDVGKGKTGNYTLQLVYLTNNPDVKKAIFYSCADIVVMG